MQHTEIAQFSTENLGETDIVSAWPTPARDAGTEDVEPRALEREIKFAVSSLAMIEERLTALQGTQAHFVDITHERNCVLDTDREELKARDERLRVREVEGRPGVMVTWKGPASAGN